MTNPQQAPTLYEPMPVLHGTGLYFIATGVAFVLLGTMALIAPLVAGLAVTTLVAWLLIAGGVMHVMNAFRGDSITRESWQALVGVFYVTAGLYYLAHPLIALGTLTASLAYVLLVEAGMDLVAWLATRGEEGSGWLLLNTIATFAFSTAIWLQWPSVSIWAIGTLVGGKLLISGISRLMT